MVETAEEPGPAWTADFNDLSREWRRLFAEAFGTLLLVLAGAGPAVVAARTHQDIGRPAAVVAPALTVVAVILFMGKVSGAHLNPIVSVSFALRREFPWQRAPLYVVAQLAGATSACLVLWATLGEVGDLGTTVPPRGITDTGFGHRGCPDPWAGQHHPGQRLGSAERRSDVGPRRRRLHRRRWSVVEPGHGRVHEPGPVDQSRHRFRRVPPPLAVRRGSIRWAIGAVGAAIILRGPGRGPNAADAAQGET